MANPGYPNMPGQMPPMGGPPMGGPPGMGGMGGPPPKMKQRSIRRGTSKAVPVVVSAGLAVGVFCGLLFGVGTGKEANATPTTASNVKKTGEEAEAKPDPGAAPKGLGATAAKPVETPKTGSAAPQVAVAAGSAAPGGSAKPAAVEEKKSIKLKIALKPEAAQKDAKITIDGKPIDGFMAELPHETKSFKLEIKSNGFRSYESKMSTIPDTAEMNVEVELQKRPAAGTGVRPPKRPDHPTNAGGGGLIDI